METRTQRVLPIAVILAIVALAFGTIAGLVISGAAKPLELADPGPVVRWGLPLVRGITDITTASTIGALVLAAFAAEEASSQLRKLLNLAGISAILWTSFGFMTVLMTYLSVTGTKISNTETFGKGLGLFLFQIALGQSMMLNVGAGAAVAILALSVRRLVPTFFVAALSLVGLVPLAVSGHASGTQGHAMAVNSLGLHLVAVTVWVGGLIALIAVKSKDEDSNRRFATRYSSLALFGYIVVAVSGVGSATVRLTTLEDLTSPYGVLVLLKSIVLIALGVFGAIYRSRLLRNMGRSGTFWRLVLAELVLMAFAMGLAAALSRTAPPESSENLANPTPAQILTGEKLPPPLTAERWFTSWKPDLIWLLVAALGISLYLLGVRRLRRRGDSWSTARTISWVSGMLLLAWITCGAMNVYQEYLFSVHMIAHMMLTMGVPLLLVPGAPVTLISRAVAKRQDGSRGTREWVLWAVHTPWAQLVSNPLFAALNFASSLVIFYFTPVFSWSTRDHLGHEWMVVHFVITGYLFVQTLVGVDPGPKPVNFPVRLIILLGTLTFHALFGLSLMQGDGLLLADWYGAMGRTWGDTPLADQHIGGAIAWGIGEFPAAILTLMVCIQWFNDDSREAKRKDRASDRSGGADLEAYNQMLSALAQKRAAAESARDAEAARTASKREDFYEVQE